MDLKQLLNNIGSGKDTYTPASDAVWDADREAPIFSVSGIPNDGRNHFILAEGIGDSAWTLAKFKDYFEETDSKVWFNEAQRRAEQYLKWVGIKEYGFCNISDTRELKVGHCEYDPNSLLGNKGTRMLQCNTWIENIEPASHKPMVGDRNIEYPLEMPEKYPNSKWRQLKDWNAWRPIANPTPEGKLIWNPGSDEVIFHASMKNYQGGNLQVMMYARIIKRILSEGFKVRLIGYEPQGHEGTWDVGYGELIIAAVEQLGGKMEEPYYNLDFNFVMDKIAQSAAFIGVDSGMSIMAIYMGVPTLRCYHPWLRYMPGTYEPEGHRSRWCYLADLPFPKSDFFMDAYPTVNRELVSGIREFIDEVKEKWS